MNRRLDARALAWLDGELTPEAEAELLAQALADPDTAEQLDAWREDLAQWDTALTPPVQPYAFATLRARLVEISPLDEVRLFLPRLRLDSPVPRFAVAAMFAAALGTSWMLGRFARGPADAPERLRDRSAYMDDMIAMSGDPTASWPDERDEA
jgi:hypothetical protein